MEDEVLPQSVGGHELPPVALDPEQEELCQRLNALHTQLGMKVSPSDMFRGAIFAARTECRNNHDWMSQAANSLREILYPFWSSRGSSALKNFGSAFVDTQSIQAIDTVYKKLNDLAHHGSNARVLDYSTFTASDFYQLVADFERVMRKALTRQVDIHKTLDGVLAVGPAKVAAEDSAARS